MAKRPLQFSPDTRLADCGERRLGIDLAPPLDRRLDDLVARAHDAGERTNRKELVAALLLEADPDSEGLARMLKRLRLATVADAVIRTPDAASDDVVVPIHRPGPRRAIT